METPSDQKLEEIMEAMKAVREARNQYRDAHDRVEYGQRDMVHWQRVVGQREDRLMGLLDPRR